LFYQVTFNLLQLSDFLIYIFCVFKVALLAFIIGLLSLRLKLMACLRFELQEHFLLLQNVKFQRGDYLVNSIRFPSFVIKILFEIKSALLIPFSFLLQDELLVFLHRLLQQLNSYSILFLVDAMRCFLSIDTLLLKTEVLYSKAFFIHSSLFTLSHLFLEVLLMSFSCFE
jgi:hypothetical protein